MAMLDSFFAKGFKGAKCRTLLKLTIPRIKLLRNRREIQLRNMRRDIAKLLETGQEATARIKVEHIIREEKMMAAQEIIELFCELITVRLPIIEAQRECPLDLKEAISSICFAAPRCADLTELLQVQMLFSAKYGKEFVAAASELRPECGVNRQLIELLSVRAPPPEVKLKLLKDIAEEYELDWDPSVSENELTKPHEDLLNGPTQYVSGSTVPLSEKIHTEPVKSAPIQEVSKDESDSDDFETIDFPEVPTQSIRSGPSAPEMLPFPASALSDDDDDDDEVSEILSPKNHSTPQEKSEVYKEYKSSDILPSLVENKQFLPFISPPSQSSVTFPATFPVKETTPPPSQPQAQPPCVPRTKSEIDAELHDVVAAAHAAAESAERAAAAARSAASLAQLKINELVTRKNEDNPFHMEETQNSDNPEKPDLDRLSSSSSLSPHYDNKVSNIPSYDNAGQEFDSYPSHIDLSGRNSSSDQFQRLPSMDEETYFSYPNLFKSQNSNLGSPSESFNDRDHSRSTHEK